MNIFIGSWIQKHYRTLNWHASFSENTLFNFLHGEVWQKAHSLSHMKENCSTKLMNTYFIKRNIECFQLLDMTVMKVVTTVAIFVWSTLIVFICLSAVNIHGRTICYDEIYLIWFDFPFLFLIRRIKRILIRFENRIKVLAVPEVRPNCT